jgi:hypothetical protein
MIKLIIEGQTNLELFDPAVILPVNIKQPVLIILKKECALFNIPLLEYGRFYTYKTKPSCFKIHNDKKVYKIGVKSVLYWGKLTYYNK